MRVTSWISRFEYRTCFTARLTDRASHFLATPFISTFSCRHGASHPQELASTIRHQVGVPLERLSELLSLRPPARRALSDFLPPSGAQLAVHGPVGRRVSAPWRGEATGSVSGLDQVEKCGETVGQGMGRAEFLVLPAGKSVNREECGFVIPKLIDRCREQYRDIDQRPHQSESFDTRRRLRASRSSRMNSTISRVA